ncbi:hypothetical protein KAI30_02650 [Candidatus Bathyarchaeota archaeon]|nr:hypothetical protein [Candidatus Bathyarchaeota archaeon]
MTYNNLEHYLGKLWLRNNPNHPYNLWRMKSEDSKEKLLLYKLDSHLGKVIPLLKTKRIQHKLRNSAEFVDTYYELEVGCYLLNQGFEVDFEQTLPSGTGNYKTPDIFVKKENVILEVKTLHKRFDVEKGEKSGEVFKFNGAKKIGDKILEVLETYSGSGIKYPLVVMLCNDYLINPPILSPDDLETVLLYRSDGLFVFGNSRVPTSDVKNDGLYYADKGQQADVLSGVGLWRKKLIRFYENPNVKKQYKITQGKFLDFLNSF